VSQRQVGCPKATDCFAETVLCLCCFAEAAASVIDPQRHRVAGFRVVLTYDQVQVAVAVEVVEGDIEQPALGGGGSFKSRELLVRHELKQCQPRVGVRAAVSDRQVELAVAVEIRGRKAEQPALDTGGDENAE